MRLRSPIKWHGGKGLFVAKLLKFVPQHKIYVEVFGGGASLLFAKEPSAVEVYNDIDSGLVNFFRVLRNPEDFHRFYKMAVLTPYSREEYLNASKTWQDETDHVLKAYKWFISARMCISGKFAQGWGYAVKTSCGGMAQTAKSWLSILTLLPLIHERFMRVQIDNDDFRAVIKRYDTEETFFYLDPPYVLSTRKCELYKHELSDKDHEELVDLLLNVKGKALLSGYPNDIYKKLEDNGWIRKDFETVCYSVGITRVTRNADKKRIESLWMNYKIGNDTIKLSGEENKQEVNYELWSKNL